MRLTEQALKIDIKSQLVPSNSKTKLLEKKQKGVSFNNKD